MNPPEPAPGSPDNVNPDAHESPPPVIPQLTADQILHEDHHLLVVNKPAPLLTQAPAGIASLEAMAKAYLKVKHNKPAGVYLGIPHRLDRPVSGVVCFARNTKAAQRVHAQFQTHQVNKIYWALVEGSVTPEAGTWEDWIRKVAAESRVERAREGEPDAKLAMLGYRVLRKFDAATTLELTPLTGRTHQLRVQAAWRGHPVLGDVLYGSSRRFGPPTEQPRDRVIALHARSLTIAHPFTKQNLTFVAPVPEYWDAGEGSEPTQDDAT